MLFARQTALILLFAILALTSLTASADELSAAVDRQTVSIDDFVNLSVTYRGNSSDTPNFDALLNNFEVVHQGQSSSTQISLGTGGSQLVNITEWALILKPKREGVFKIPAFVIDGASSEPIEITVTDSGVGNASSTEPDTSADNANTQKIYLETEVSTAKPYVQQQVLMTIRLISEYSIEGGDGFDSAPVVPTAKVEQVYSGNYQRQRNGKNQLVVERIYAIYPQTDGTLTIPAIDHTVVYVVPRNNSQPWGFLNRGQRMQAHFKSDVLTLHVQPQPENYTGEEWLPANALKLEQHWSADPKRLVVGEPITRDIKIVAEGLLDSQLPVIEQAQVDGFKNYPDQPQLDKDISNTGVVGRRSQSTALMPTRPGRFTLPEVSVDWWDVATNTQKRATLPAQEIVVMSAASDGSEPAPFTPAPTDAEQQIVESATEQPSQVLPSRLWPWVASTIFFALTTLWFALLWLSGKKRTMKPAHKVETSKDEKLALKELKRHCDNCLLPGVRKSLLAWADIRFSGCHTLDQLQRELDQIKDGKTLELQQLIKQLDQALYSNSDAKVDCNKLYQLVAKLPTAPKNRAPQNSLVPLYH